MEIISQKQKGDEIVPSLQNGFPQERKEVSLDIQKIRSLKNSKKCQDKRENQTEKGLKLQIPSEKDNQNQNLKTKIFLQEKRAMLTQIVNFIQIFTIFSSIIVLGLNNLSLELILLIMLLILSRSWKIIYLYKQKQYGQFVMCIFFLDPLIIYQRGRQERSFIYECNIVDKVEERQIQKEVPKSEGLQNKQSEPQLFNKEPKEKKSLQKEKSMKIQVNELLKQELKKEKVIDLNDVNFKIQIQDKETDFSKNSDQKKQKIGSNHFSNSNLSFLQRDHKIESDTVSHKDSQDHKLTSLANIEYAEPTKNQSAYQLSTENEDFTKLQIQQTAEDLSAFNLLQTKLQSRRQNLSKRNVKDKRIQQNQDNLSQLVHKESKSNQKMIHRSSLLTLNVKNSLNNSEIKEKNVSKQSINLNVENQIVNQEIKEKQESKNKIDLDVGTSIVRKEKKRRKNTFLTFNFEQSIKLKAIFSEQYFITRKLELISVPIIDGISLSALSIIILMYWLLGNCDKIEMTQQVIIIITMLVCSSCMALSLNLFSSVQYTLLEYRKGDQQKRFIDKTFEFFEILFGIFASFLCLALGLHSSLYLIFIEIPILIWMIYEVNVFLKNLFRKEILKDPKLLVLLRIILSISSLLYQYLLIICNFQIYLSKEFMDISLPLMLEDISEMKLQRSIQFQNKFEIFCKILKKTLMILPVHSAIFFIFDFFKAASAKEIDQWNFLNIMRILALCMWIISSTHFFIKYRKQKQFIDSILNYAIENNAQRKRKLLDKYWNSVSQVEENQNVLKQSEEQSLKSEKNIVELLLKINLLKENEEKICVFLQTFGGNQGGQASQKRQLLKESLENRAKIKQQIEQSKKDKIEADQIQIDSKKKEVGLQEQLNKFSNKLKLIEVIPTEQTKNSKK